MIKISFINVDFSTGGLKEEYAELFSSIVYPLGKFSNFKPYKTNTDDGCWVLDQANNWRISFLDTPGVKGEVAITYRYQSQLSQAEEPLVALLKHIFATTGVIHHTPLAE